MFSSRKPYTAITANIDRLCMDSHAENDYSGIPDLIEVISIQSTGPTEAARAIRKKLKYGQPPAQRQALTVLDALIQNAGPTFQHTIAHDTPLIERLQICATDPTTDPSVKKKLQTLFSQWHASFATIPNLALLSGLQKATHGGQSLRRVDGKDPDQVAQAMKTKDWNGPGRAWDRHYDPIKEAKRRKKIQKEKEREQALRDFDAAAGHSRGPSSSSNHSAFNLKTELPALQQTLAQSHLEATSLLNALQHHQSHPQSASQLASSSPDTNDAGHLRKSSVSHSRKASIAPGSLAADPALMAKYASCKALRRRVLRYIENIADEQWLGGLISANEALVNSLHTFEVLDGAAAGEDTDSDSDLDLMSGRVDRRPGGKGDGQNELQDAEEEEEDENDPFADRNAIK